jgi:cephalosporin-C deacetylase
VDALRALGAVRSLPDVDASSIAVQGSSQGGGITLAAGGLTNGLVAVMPDVPFLCHFRRAADICDEPPYTEIIRYLAIRRGVGDSAFTTLSYFDGVSFAKRASAPALSSVGLMDQVCPAVDGVCRVSRVWRRKRTSSFTRSMTMEGLAAQQRLVGPTVDIKTR